MSWSDNNLIPTQKYVLDGQSYMESQLGNNYFTWLVDGNNYTCVASIVDFKGDLETGGFTITKLVNITVRLLDNEGNSTFPNGTPQSQQKIMYKGVRFRISNVSQDSVGSGTLLLITGISDVHGI